MKKSKLWIVAALAVLVTGAAAAAALATSGSSGKASAAMTMQHDHMALTASQLSGNGKAADLRVTLDTLLGEHALLAIEATQSGYSGAKDFPALAKAVDANAVDLSKAI